MNINDYSYSLSEQSWDGYVYQESSLSLSQLDSAVSVQTWIAKGEETSIEELSRSDWAVGVCGTLPSLMTGMGEARQIWILPSLGRWTRAGQESWRT